MPVVHNIEQAHRQTEYGMGVSSNKVLQSRFASPSPDSSSRFFTGEIIHLDRNVRDYMVPPEYWDASTGKLLNTDSG